MSNTTDKGFELFTKTFQEQYALDAHLLRDVAWEVWRNELTDRDRAVWARMAEPQAPEPEPHPPSPPALEPETDSEPAFVLEETPDEVPEPEPEPEPEPGSAFILEGPPAEAPESAFTLEAAPESEPEPEPAFSLEAAPESAPEPEPAFSLETTPEETREPEPAFTLESEPSPEQVEASDTEPAFSLEEAPEMAPEPELEPAPAPSAEAETDEEPFLLEPDLVLEEIPEAETWLPDPESLTKYGADAVQVVVALTEEPGEGEERPVLTDTGLFGLDEILSAEDSQTAGALAALTGQDGWARMLPPEPEEIEPLEDDTAPAAPPVVAELTPEEPRPELSPAERALARFRALAGQEDSGPAEPDFLVDEPQVQQRRQSLARAKSAAVRQVAGQATALGAALRKRVAQGDTLALRLFIQHLLPEDNLRALSRALVERALDLGHSRQPLLLPLLAGGDAAPQPSPEQAANLAGMLVRQALGGDVSAMEVCLKLLPQAVKVQAGGDLGEKLLQQALKGDILLLALILERLRPLELTTEEAAELSRSLLQQARDGDDAALKACLAGLMDE